MIWNVLNTFSINAAIMAATKRGIVNWTHFLRNVPFLNTLKTETCIVVGGHYLSFPHLEKVSLASKKFSLPSLLLLYLVLTLIKLEYLLLTDNKHNIYFDHWETPQWKLTWKKSKRKPMIIEFSFRFTSGFVVVTLDTWCYSYGRSIHLR